MHNSLITLKAPAGPQDQQRYASPPAGALGLIVAQMAQHMTGLLLVITPDQRTAQQLSDDYRFFISDNVDTGAATTAPLLNFPDWEVLPYDMFSPHQDIISERLRTLYQLTTHPKGILICAVNTLMQHIAPVSHITQNSLVLKTGDTIDLKHFKAQLINSGYHSVNEVYQHGEFAMRGSLLDIYPMGSVTPFRIDFFDTDIDSIRVFDTETQRSSDTIQSIDLLPAREYPTTDAAISQFRQTWREYFDGNPMDAPTYESVSNHTFPAGIEAYLPLFFERTATLFDYLPENTTLMRIGDLETECETFWQDLTNRYEQRRHDRVRPLLAPDNLYLPFVDFMARCKQFPRLDFVAPTLSKATALPIEHLADIHIDNKRSDPFALFKDTLNPAVRTLFVAESAGRQQTLTELLSKHEVQPKPVDNWQAFFHCTEPICITSGHLGSGFYLREPELNVITEAELFGSQVLHHRKQKKASLDPSLLIKNLAELNIDAPIVHIDHGVGRYQGLQTLDLGDHVEEFLTLAYAENDKLMVPVSSLHLISRYSGTDPDSAPIHRLGGDRWQKAKKKAQKQAQDVAAELLDLYAKREARAGFSFTIDETAYQRFAGEFPFEETPDQEKAIHAVVNDMQQTQPMDRLICGDVGFGKTEVAMRAAFMAVQNQKQVAVLVPTTLLANQHFQTFVDRFATWPINIALLSRFNTPKEQQTTLDKLSKGSVDIVIGTHKLIQPNIKFKNLGLVIIDEEHRFGVKQKDQFKALRAEVDILALTATPIPRSLNMAMSELRELSIISTPPARRLSIKTFVQEWQDGLIQEAIAREVMRGGQVFFLHNKVETINQAAERLQGLMPDAKIAVAHGQLRERELESIMSDFYHQRYNILVCSTIIETGIDIPNANTIIIDRADKFGLAQLHQLRGRVGRSHHQAYAYLITPHYKALSRDAKKRLEAISALEDLGVGFMLATHDLEIRGAGELLGKSQSGHMQEIGFSLYTELLERAVEAIKSGHTPEASQLNSHPTELKLNITALLPNDYLADVHMRLMLYKRIAGASDQNALDELRVEMIDRFGPLPEPTQHLFKITQLKLLASPLGIRNIVANATYGRLEFDPNATIDPNILMGLIKKTPELYRFEGPTVFRFAAPMSTAARRLDKIQSLLHTLQRAEV